MPRNVSKVAQLLIFQHRHHSVLDGLQGDEAERLQARVINEQREPTVKYTANESTDFTHNDDYRQAETT